MTILLETWLVASRVLKGWLIMEWHLHWLLDVRHSNLRIIWNGHNHQRHSRINHWCKLEVLALNLGNLRRIYWHVVSHWLSVETLSTRVSLLIVKFWLRLHQGNILKAAECLRRLRRVLVPRKVLSLTFKSLLMLDAVQFSFLNQLRWTFPNKTPQSWNNHFFLSLLVQCLMFA